MSKRSLRNLCLALSLAALAGCSTTGGQAPGSGTTAGETASAGQGETFSENEVVRAAENFFGKGAEGLAQVISAAFARHGRPNAYIAGEEGGGALTVGLRYGGGNLVRKSGETRYVYWQGPSIGLDVGGSAAKTFILVYGLPADTGKLFGRYPGVEGSLYYVAGFGMNANENANATLVPIRFGVGWRQGVNVGYLKVTDEQTWNPF